MLEQLKTARFVLGLIAGTAKVDDLRKKMIAEAKCTDDAGKPMKYKDLGPDDKKGCDEAVAAMQEIKGVFDDIIDAKARMTFAFYEALQKAGFDKAEALAITAAQPVELKTGD